MVLVGALSAGFGCYGDTFEQAQRCTQFWNEKTIGSALALAGLCLVLAGACSYPLAKRGGP